MSSVPRTGQTESTDMRLGCNAQCLSPNRRQTLVSADRTATAVRGHTAARGKVQSPVDAVVQHPGKGSHWGWPCFPLPSDG